MINCMEIQITDTEKECLINAINSCNLDDKRTLHDVLKQLKNG